MNSESLVSYRAADNGQAGKSAFIIWTVLVAILVIVAVLVGHHNLRTTIEERLEENVEDRIDSIRGLLDTTHQLYTERVINSMQVLRHLTAARGAPAVHGEVTIDGRTLHDLRFGDHRVGLDFTLVDQTVELSGGTATIFARDGGDFVRISTNVQRPDGSRAIGTILNPQGPVYRALITNQPFYGVVDILGDPYITAYEPIRSRNGALIGIYYVGYRVETLDVLGADIARNRLLDQGFMALIDHQGRALFPVENVSADQLSAAADHAITSSGLTQRWQEGGWNWYAERFPQWNFTLLAAVRQDDIRNRSLRSAVSVLGLMVPLLALALTIAFLGTRKLKHTLEQSQRLKAEADRLSLVASRTHNGVIITAPDGKVEWVNDGFTRMTGFHAADIIGRHPDEVLTDADTDPVTLEAKNRARAAGEGFQQELLVHRKDGRPLWMMVDGQPMRTREGGITGWVVVQVDITQRKAEEEELRLARAAAEEANRTKSAFLANMSHELRTPMNAIIGYSEMLIEEAEDLEQEDFIPDLNRIHGAGKHLLGLINDVLDLSKIEAGKMTLYLEDIAVPDLLGEVAGTIRPLVEKNRNRLVIDCPDDLGPMHTDVTKVRQSLFNLLSNAAKFTEDGEIRVSVRREPDDATGRDGHWIAFEVADTGIGMTPEQLSRLFRAFTQADASTTRKYGGTGLGLVISRSFCQLMGGDISVRSEAGTGTTFTIRLPQRAQPTDTGTRAPFTPAAGPEASPEPADANAPLILVVDDDPNMVDLLTRSLAREGYRTCHALSGHDALKLAREQQPALITLDVMMPSLDGWSVLTKLKAEPAVRDIPVVMVSIVDDKQLGFSLGAADYLTKPVDRTRLAAVLQRHVRRDQPQLALIVDDLPDNRTMLRGALESEGWQAVEAPDGAAALKIFGEHHPNLILLDLMMPGMDGFQFIKALRAREDGKSVPVIVVTAKDLTPEEREELRQGVENIVQIGAAEATSLLAEIREKIARIGPHE